MEHKTKLSKGILELKFMKRSKEKFEKQEDEEERQRLYNDQLSTLHSGAKYVSIVPSHYDCHDYLPCRLSFGGHEPDTEKLNCNKLKGMYAPLRAVVAPLGQDGGMQVDASAEEVYRCLSNNQEEEVSSQQDGGKRSFVHKNTKANRFDVKPKRKFDNTDGDRGKGRGRGHNRSNDGDRGRGRGHNRSSDGDRGRGRGRGHNRSSDGDRGRGRGRGQNRSRDGDRGRGSTSKSNYFGPDEAGEWNEGQRNRNDADPEDNGNRKRKSDQFTQEDREQPQKKFLKPAALE